MNGKAKSDKTTAKPTIRSIARDLDISFMTVFRVLNGNPSVKEETRKRILDRVKELGYDYDREVKTKSKREKRVAVYCSNAKFHGDNLFNFFMRLYYLCVKSLKAAGLQTFLLDPEIMEQPDQEALAGYGALVILGTFTPGEKIFAQWQKMYPKLPIISVIGDPLPCFSIEPGDLTGGSMAARIFYENGHRHIAIFTCSDEQGLQKRFTGCAGEMSRLCSDAEIEQIFYPLTKERPVQKDIIDKTIDQFFCQHQGKNMPTAFFCTNGYDAWILAQYIQSHGWRIPEDFSILGYDDLDLIANNDPPISRICFDLKSVASAVAVFLKLKNSLRLKSDFMICIMNRFIKGASIANLKSAETTIKPQNNRRRMKNGISKTERE